MYMNKLMNRRVELFIARLKGSQQFATRMAMAVIANAVTTLPMWAIGGGRMASTQSIANVATELSGPFAYGASLVMVVGSAIYWYRHHHDMGALGNGVLGTAFVAGVAMGAPTVLSMVPGATGALI
jgi:TrbC/VIRB2 pilin